MCRKDMKKRVFGVEMQWEYHPIANGMGLRTDQVAS